MGWLVGLSWPPRAKKQNFYKWKEQFIFLGWLGWLAELAGLPGWAWLGWLAELGRARLQVTGYRFQVTGPRLQVTGSSQPSWNTMFLLEFHQKSNAQELSTIAKYDASKNMYATQELSTIVKYDAFARISPKNHPQICPEILFSHILLDIYIYIYILFILYILYTLYILYIIYTLYILYILYIYYIYYI